ncbi:MAG: HAD hydrolase-like protein [Eubacteriales bacterium]|nr:HAD hydrolase-like protein [Eubacteriales bacterium]
MPDLLNKNRGGTAGGGFSGFEQFEKKKEYLVCVDSDGCAMNTMDIKHIRCFGPSMVQEWELWRWQEEAEFQWNRISLYSKTRGINRFKGLYETLKFVNAHMTEIDGLCDLEKFVTESDELSNPALARYIEKTGSGMLKKTLHWSEVVNAEIKQLTKNDRLAFIGVQESLELLCEKADIVIVSSATPQAVKEEWETNGILKYVSLVCAQDAGSKAYCIGRLLEKGYDKEKVIMIGDAPGDMAAAKKCGVSFFPIEVRREIESWEKFRTHALPAFFGGSYRGACEDAYIESFENNLM